MYQKVRDFRHNSSSTEAQFKELFLQISQQAASEWLLFIELVEISHLKNFSKDFLKLITFHLDQLKNKNPELAELIQNGLVLAELSLYAPH